MRKFTTFAIATATALAFAAPAGATIINLDGFSNAIYHSTESTGHTAKSLTLGPGTYKVTFTEGQYTAFNRWSSSSGCDSSGANCRNGWENSAAIAVGSTNGSVVFNFGDRSAQGGYFHGNAGEQGYFKTAALSFAHAGMYSQLFTLTSAQTVYFYLRDNAFNDNSGGVSLNIVHVPEPAAWPFLLAGFGVFGLLALRRRRIAMQNAA